MKIYLSQIFTYQNYPIVPLLWLIDNGIIDIFCLGCEKESLDQGRFYVDKNIIISNCFFSRNLSYSERGGVKYVFWVLPL